MTQLEECLDSVMRGIGGLMESIQAGASTAESRREILRQQNKFQYLLDGMEVRLLEAMHTGKKADQGHQEQEEEMVDVEGKESDMAQQVEVGEEEKDKADTEIFDLTDDMGLFGDAFGEEP